MKEQEESRRGVVRTRLCEGQETACRRDRFTWWSTFFAPLQKRHTKAQDAGARESRCKRMWTVGSSIGGILAYPTNTVSHASMPRMHAADSEARPR